MATSLRACAVLTLALCLAAAPRASDAAREYTDDLPAYRNIFIDHSLGRARARGTRTCGATDRALERRKPSFHGVASSAAPLATCALERQAGPRAEAHRAAPPPSPLSCLATSCRHADAGRAGGREGDGGEGRGSAPCMVLGWRNGLHA
eukprot:365732-Chlamydomonas_euryale.AAC.3